MGLIRRNGQWIEDGTPSPYHKDRTPKQKTKTIPESQPLTPFFVTMPMVKRGGRPKGSKNKPSLVTEAEREALRAFRGNSRPYELPKHIPKHDNVRKELTPIQRDKARERARDAERLHLGLCKWNEWEY